MDGAQHCTKRSSLNGRRADTLERKGKINCGSRLIHIYSISGTYCGDTSGMYTATMLWSAQQEFLYVALTYCTLKWYLGLESQ